MDIRQTILERLEQTERTRYWLAKRAEREGVCNSETVYRYLRGERDTTGEIAGRLLDMLGGRITFNKGRAHGA